ncbi:alanine dehydrogenase [Raineyella fluvialis]|uniref:Alanine dehydrogenase n=1 Tax=Raineyella fluvialis TaxID=2662261 RepID=A0A5Q2FA90_9ACTN|nr:alanine dehydrogenase [Raineyella fluvialis]QGF23719.1 alanine dehydrogenase [Raineyella fluvialis]
MRVAVPTEIKSEEHRVAVTPAGVRELVADGHEVVIQSGAGLASDITDEDFERVGADITDDPDALWHWADLVCKVKEPQPVEIARLREGQLLFAYLHLAPDAAQTRGLIASGATCVAYETVTDAAGNLPLLAPMSAVAGRLAAQVGARLLEGFHGGRGLLMGGVPGVPAARVLVFGAGVVGSNAIRVALGMGADVTVLDVNLDKLAHLDSRFGAALTTIHSSRLAVEESLQRADLVIGAALVPGALTPKLVTRDQLRLMPQGAAVVDVAIDQGGCFETSRPTTHRDPTYWEGHVLHYCVANMPSAVAATATRALANATQPYLVRLANGGIDGLVTDHQLRAGLNIHRGMVTNAAVAEALGLEHIRADEALLED